jgi:hypothetical protein
MVKYEGTPSECPEHAHTPQTKSDHENKGSYMPIQPQTHRRYTAASRFPGIPKPKQLNDNSKQPTTKKHCPQSYFETKSHIEMQADKNPAQRPPTTQALTTQEPTHLHSMNTPLRQLRTRETADCQGKITADTVDHQTLSIPSHKWPLLQEKKTQSTTEPARKQPPNPQQSTQPRHTKTPSPGHPTHKAQIHK